ncbi:MAG: ABC transporter permease [Oscillospiraceae bacterium]|nr:ABC transporter permease [Oscillospiraceae bacterium]
MKSAKKKRGLLILALGLLLAGACLCLWRLYALASEAPAQYAAERWQGESERRFAQVSCFVPVDEAVSRNQIYAFRAKLMEELNKASLDGEGTDGLWRDAWSAVGKLQIASDKGSAEASVIAVGGDFFSFHPLRLLGGGYLSEDDLMKDRVVLDRELAWKLYGGTELQGLSVEIAGRRFVIAGVVEREQDAASRMAYTAGMGLFMSCESYAALSGNENCITAYELVLTEPVDGFAADVAGKNFPLGRGEVLKNTGRFSYGRLLGLLAKTDERSMQAMGMIYPYWENAARVTENRCLRLLLAAMLLALAPAAALVVWIVRLLKRFRRWLAERFFPRAKDAAEEAVRRPLRRRWEKTHPDEK